LYLDTGDRQPFENPDRITRLEARISDQETAHQNPAVIVVNVAPAAVLRKIAACAV
jgi:hypothetical protein